LKATRNEQHHDDDNDSNPNVSSRTLFQVAMLCFPAVVRHIFFQSPAYNIFCFFCFAIVVANMSRQRLSTVAASVLAVGRRGFALHNLCLSPFGVVGLVLGRGRRTRRRSRHFFQYFRGQTWICVASSLMALKPRTVDFFTSAFMIIFLCVSARNLRPRFSAQHISYPQCVRI
jgi:hypothetical protein